jgi:hypothetical protein
VYNHANLALTILIGYFYTSIMVYAVLTDKYTTTKLFKTGMKIIPSTLWISNNTISFVKDIDARIQLSYLL